MMSLLPNVAGHVAVEHTNGLESWSHYLSADKYLLIAVLAGWAAFLLIQNAGLRRNRFKTQLQVGFAGVNIVAAVLLRGDNLPVGLLLLSGGFLMLIWALFAGKADWQQIFKTEENGRD